MDISIRRGETLELDVTLDDETAETVQLLVSTDDNSIIINETVNTSTTEGVTTASIRVDDTDFEEGDYQYMLVITYSDGVVDYLPDTAQCEDDCDLPTFTICESIIPGVS